MSSLRISHQNRAIGASAAGTDGGRAETSGTDTTFALALGAAAGVVSKGAATLFGGTTGDNADNSTPRKRTAADAKADSAAASLAGQYLSSTQDPLMQGLPTTPSWPARQGEAHSKDDDVAGSIAAQGTPAANTPNALTANPLGLLNTAPGSDGVDPVATASGNQVDATPLAAGPTASAGTRIHEASETADTAVSDAPSESGTVVTASNPIAASVAPSGAITSQPAATTALLAARETAPVAGGIASDRTPMAPVGLNGNAGAAPASNIIVPVNAANAPAAAPETLAPGPADGALSSSPEITLAGTGSISPAHEPTNKAPTADTAQPSRTLLAGLLQSPLSSTSGPQITGGDSSERGRLTPVAAASDAGNTTAAAIVGNANLSAAGGSPSGAPGSAADPGGASTIADQVTGQLARMVSNGMHDVVMRLHPPELGDLTIRIAVSGHDVSAWFVSPQPQVQSAISDAIGQLRTDLSNAGYNLNGAWVGADASGAGQQGSSLPAPPEVRSPFSPPSAGVSATVVSRPSPSGLNLYV